MVKYVQSRANVFLALFKTEVSQFSIPAPGSAEHVLLIEGERQGAIKTLEMIMRMLMQLQKDSPHQFYSLHRDFYDPANASSAALADKYGGFGKKILQPPPHVVKKVTPKKMIGSSVLKKQNKGYGSMIQSSKFESVKARMCAADDGNNNQQFNEEYFKELEVTPNPRCFPIFPAETSPHCNEPKVITAHLCQVSRATMSQSRSELTEDVSNHQVQSLEEPACGPNSFHQAEPFSTVEENVSDHVVGEGLVDTEELNMTMCKAIADTVRCQDNICDYGVEVKIAGLVSSTEVILSLKGTREQVRDAYSKIQSFAVIADPV